MQIYTEDGDMIRINKKKFLFMALVLILSGILIGQGLVQAKSDTYDELKAFTQALELIKRNYVEDPNAREIIQGAIRGMVSSLDPHSSFMAERAYKEMDMDIRGEFQGVGIQIGLKNSQLTVIAPIEDTPADVELIVDDVRHREVWARASAVWAIRAKSGASWRTWPTCAWTPRCTFTTRISRVSSARPPKPMARARVLWWSPWASTVASS